MSAALRLYEQLTEATDHKTRARPIAEAFAKPEDRFPQLADLATQGHVRKSELRLQKEIEGVRKKIKEVEGRLLKEIKELEGRLRKEIEQIPMETKALEVRLTRAIHRQTIWIIGAVGTVVGLVRVLDALIK